MLYKRNVFAVHISQIRHRANSANIYVRWSGAVISSLRDLCRSVGLSVNIDTSEIHAAYKNTAETSNLHNMIYCDDAQRNLAYLRRL